MEQRVLGKKIRKTGPFVPGRELSVNEKIRCFNE
jgi:hypothetical protein